MMSLPRLLAATCVAVLALTGVAGADGDAAQRHRRAGFAIALTDGSGAAVSTSIPGTFTLTVDDKSDEHNFHLQGPGGVDVATEVEGVGTKTFTVPLVDGKYTFVCDAHPARMKGTFTVGTQATEPPPTAGPSRLALTVASKVVTLTTPAGKRVNALAGPAVITARDRSALRGVRLGGQASTARPASASSARDLEGEADAGNARLHE